MVTFEKPHEGSSPMTSRKLDEAAVWDALKDIADPEIPVLSLVDMKIIRQVKVEDKIVHVSMSPTFLGCPAFDQMKSDVRQRLLDVGFSDVVIATSFSPPWTTAMLDAAAREKLREFGIAPPGHHEHDLTQSHSDIVVCPFCGSERTHLENSFGPTLCRQIYYCDSCLQPFERFKSL